MLFNILHAERPNVLLKEALPLLRPSGVLAIVHWNYDPATRAVRRWKFAPVLNSAATGQSRKASGS